MQSLAAMRWTLLTLALTACLFETGAEVSTEGVGDERSGCALDSDCALAASSCCRCPTFATLTGAGDCDSVECAPADCAPAEAFCDRGQCRLRCAEVVATQDCASGFEVDEAGCTIDRCAAETSTSECAIDDDCVRAPADCCGCEQGGRDTAVPAGALDAHLEGLDCADGSLCPQIDACEPDSEVRCLGGICRLVSGSGLDVPTSVCGAPEAGGCATDEICVLNAPEAPPGAGICRSR